MFDFFERWDLSIGIVSLVLLVPTVVHFVRTQLPSRRLRKLLELLSETEALFTASIEEGLLKNHETYTYQGHLTTLRNGAEEVRAEIYAGRGCGEDFSKLLHGLTRRINYLCVRVKELRNSISTTSMRERERRRRLAAARRSSTQSQPVADDQPEPSPRMWEKVWTSLCIFGAGPDPQRDDYYLATPLRVVDTPASAHVDQPSWSVHAAHTLSPPPPPPPPQPSLPDVALATPSLARTDTDERTLCSRSASARSSTSHSTVSSPKWKLRVTPTSRKRAVAQHPRRSRAARAKASRLPKAPTVPSSVLASLEPRSGGEEDEWVDVF